MSVNCVNEQCINQLYRDLIAQFLFKALDYRYDTRQNSELLEYFQKNGLEAGLDKLSDETYQEWLALKLTAEDLELENTTEDAEEQYDQKLNLIFEPFYSKLPIMRACHADDTDNFDEQILSLFKELFPRSCFPEQLTKSASKS